MSAREGARFERLPPNFISELNWISRLQLILMGPLVWTGQNNLYWQRNRHKTCHNTWTLDFQCAVADGHNTCTAAVWFQVRCHSRRFIWGATPFRMQGSLGSRQALQWSRIVFIWFNIFVQICRAIGCATTSIELSSKVDRTWMILRHSVTLWYSLSNNRRTLGRIRFWWLLLNFPQTWFRFSCYNKFFGWTDRWDWSQ